MTRIKEIEGIIPPQALDAEEVVLGAIMIESEAIDRVIDILTTESFYNDKNRKVFRAQASLFKKGEPVDILTVTNELRSMKLLDDVGGPYAVSQLTNRVATAENIEYHARIVAQKFLAREVIRMSTEAIKKSYDDSNDIFDIMDALQKDISSANDLTGIRHEKGSAVLVQQFAEHTSKAKKSRDEGVPTGVATGLVDVDNITGGFQKTDLVILAARPGMGKTGMTKRFIKGAIDSYRKPVAMFSLEMSSLQLMARLVSEDKEIPASKLMSGDFPILTNFEDSYKKYFNKDGEDMLYIDDTAAITDFELTRRATRLKQEKDICMVIVDYIQLMRSSTRKQGNREQEVAEISRNLKKLAKELDIPVIALAQLSRGVETRGGLPIPRLADLRESGAIEQDADVVMFIYRPYY